MSSVPRNPPDDHHHNTNQKHQNGDLIDPMHEAQVHVGALPAEQVAGIEVVGEFFQDHVHVDWPLNL